MAVNGGQWVSGRDLRAEARMRLFCLPHAGSGAAGFYRWKAGLREYGIDVCPVMLPGRESRMGEPALTEVAAVVVGLMAVSAALAETPYAIYGHSMGALLAFRWAVALARSGLRGPTCLIVSGRNAPQVAGGGSLLHGLADDEFLAELEGRYGAFAPGLLDDAELRAIFLPILRADLTLVERFRFVAGERLTCPVVALAGERDANVSDVGLMAWGELTDGRFAWERLPGDHFFHLGVGQGRLLEVIGERLATLQHSPGD